MNQAFSENDIDLRVENALGIITLNRPAQLNALNLEMIRGVMAALSEWETDDAIQAVLFQGAGDRAFCAGGDLRAFYKAGMDYRRGAVDGKVASLYFREEYRLNHRLFHYPKPLVSWMSGIVMGGGYGVGGNCRFRIVDETARFAMPEAAIGFFPDVGSMYHLARAGAMGRYLAVTGLEIGPWAMARSGLADYLVLSSKRAEVTEALAAGRDAQDVLTKLGEDAAEARDLDAWAEEVFAPDKSIEEVWLALQTDVPAFTQGARAALETRCPLSIAVADEYFQRAQGLDFDSILRTDFIIAQHFLARRDLYEGIRALIIDKDRDPSWEHKSLADLPAGLVQRCFEPTGYDLF